jgi:hypothetical protein
MVTAKAVGKTKKRTISMKMEAKLPMDSMWADTKWV